MMIMIWDGDDNCPNTPTGEEVDAYGCAESQKDDDGDGVPNKDDLRPYSPTPGGGDYGCSGYEYCYIKDDDRECYIIDNIDCDNDGIVNDGILNENEICPEEVGPEDNYGCPLSINNGLGLPCPKSYSPACGVDNKTYVNSCVVEALGIQVAYYGRCKDIRPDDCPVEIDYVCGVDGRTYDNSCLAIAYGTKVATEWRCEEG